MPDIYRQTKDEYHLPKGVSNRNKGLEWILKFGVDDAVVYFADDDNTYDLRLFHEVLDKSNFERHFAKCGVKRSNPHGKQVPFADDDREYITCDVCNYQTLYVNIMKRHMTLEHTENKEKVKCDKCEREFLSKAGVRHHKSRVHSNGAINVGNNFWKRT